MDDTQARREEFRSLLAAGDSAELRAATRTWHPADLAEALADLPPADLWRVLSPLAAERRAEVFSHLRLGDQVALARFLNRTELAVIMTHMLADERADLYNRLAPDEREALLPALSQAEREDIRRLAAYREGTAGAIMTSEYATLTADLTAREAIEMLRREAPDKETIYRAYVLDAERHLLGSVRLQSLILAGPRTPVRELMEASSPCVHVDDDQEEVARQIAKYDILALPVVDDEGRIVGIVTYDDAMDVATEEATEDFHKLGANAGRLPISVREASVATLYRRRVPWLVLLVFGNLFSGAGIAYFEETIAAYIVLVFFLPLLIGSAGNAGSQAATLMVRSLATGDVRPRDWAYLFGKELLVAGVIGLTMALAVAFIGWFRGGPEIALVVALSMTAVVVMGSLIGMSLPFILNRAGLDPATASAPLVTTIADAVGVLIYFTIATLFLGMPS